MYRPPDLRSVALVDELAESLDSASGGGNMTTTLFAAHDDSSVQQGGGGGGGRKMRKPLLRREVMDGVPREQVLEKVLRPFFRQLSILAFESTYGMEGPDWGSRFGELVGDLFEDGTLV